MFRLVPPQPDMRGRKFAARGFTLIELLVTVSIMLVMMALAAAAVQSAAKGDRIASATRQLQSALEGARARAFQRGDAQREGSATAVGVRLLRDPQLAVDDPDDPLKAKVASSITGMVYVEQPPWEQGQLEFPNSADASLVRFSIAAGNTGNGSNTGIAWADLFQRGLLLPWHQIRIMTNGSMRTYTIRGDDPTIPYDFATAAAANQFRITPDYLGTEVPTGPTPYILELVPAIRADAQPVSLPRGVVLDYISMRKAGTVPAWWGADNSPMDIMFTPRGSVRGRLATQGVMRFVFAEEDDVANGLEIDDLDSTAGPNLPLKKPRGDTSILSLYTLSGTIHSSGVDYTDALTNATNSGGPDGLIDDPFKLAKQGEESR